MFWVGLSNLTLFINSVVWDKNIVNWSPVWCDITSRLVLATNVAIPATALCIQRRLYYIISDPVVTITKSEKRRSLIVDSLIGFGIPVLNMILTYIVQEHRYDIYEDVGCYPAIINTAVSLVLISAWPIVIGLVTGVYCSLNIYHFWIKRRTVRSLLASTSGSLNFSRYIRLMVLSGIDLLCTLPLAVWGLYSQATLAPVLPWPGWDAVHANFSHVDQIPAILWRSDHNSLVAMELTRWSSVMCAIIFFIFFGFADEARKHYTQALQSVAKKAGYTSFMTQSTSESYGYNYGSRFSKGFSERPMSSMFSDEFVLPVFNKDQNSDPEKRSPFGLSYGKSKSAITISTDCDTVSDSSSSRDMEKSPMTPQLPTTPIIPPPTSLDPETTRRGVRPPVFMSPMGASGLGL